MKPFGKFKTGALAALFLSIPLFAGNMPFPQNKSYGLEPQDGTESTRAAAVKSRFDWYKSNFLKTASGNGKYIEAVDTDGDKSTATVSEAHGYGMMLAAIMDDQSMFNDMYTFYQSYTNNGALMDWQIWDNFTSEDGSATDGDLDIAYALLLADKQWGSSGTINYKSKANTLISDIWNYEMYTSGQIVPMPGDKTVWYLSPAYGSSSWTRPSDWMAGHFRAFQGNGTGEWTKAADGIYSFYNSYKNATTGLVPDFFYGTSPASSSHYIENSTTDGQYYMNACRVPLRFAMDYASSKNASAKTALEKIGTWISGASSNDAAKIWPGYTLSGTATNTNYNAVEFIGPFGAGLIATDKQTLLNSCWDQLKQSYNYQTNNSYGTALGILSMLVMTGNWWAPDADNSGNTGTLSGNKVVFDDFKNTYHDANNQTTLGAAQAVDFGIKLAENGDSSFYGDPSVGTGWWYVSTDAADKGTSTVASGSTVLTETNMEKAVSNGVLDLKFTINSTKDLPWGYASIGAPIIADLVKKSATEVTATDKFADFSKLDAVIITYSSDQEVWFELATKDAKDKIGYGGWGYALASTNGAFKTDTIKAGYLVPQLYSEWETAVKAAGTTYSWDKTGKTAVEGIGFSAAGDSGKTVTTNLKIKEIILNGLTHADLGFSYRDPSPIAPAARINLANQVNALVTTTNVTLSFAAKQAGMATASFYSMNGREMIRTQSAVTSGANSMNISTRDLAAGMYVMRLSVNGLTSTSRISILK